MSQVYYYPAVTVPAPVGGATAANQVLEIAQLTAINANTDGVEASLTSIDGKTPALGQALAAASVPVVLTAAQISTLTPQTDALTDAQLRATPVPVSGTVSTGGLTDAELRATPVPVSLTSTTITGTVAATQSGTWNITNVSGTVSLPTGASTEATLSTLNGKVPANLTVTATRLLVDGSGVTQPVSGTVTATPAVAATSTLSNVSGSASNVTLLASNGSRKGAMIYNDSSALLYVKFGTTASTTSFTVLMQAGAFFELPGPTIYTGIIDGIWASATGAARVTEIT